MGLTARTAVDLGYVLSEEDTAKNFIEVSGRKGFGVKADDLIDRMIAAARAEVDARHPELDEAERAEIASAIGVGALRFFLLRFTRNTVIAFDYQDALAFDGETGPYAQYAAVRAANIFRKAGVSAEAALEAVADLDLSTMLEGEEGNQRLGDVADSFAAVAGVGAGDCGCGACDAGSLCVHAGPAVQQLLPSPPHSDGDGRVAEDASAGNCSRRAPGTGFVCLAGSGFRFRRRCDAPSLFA